MEYAQNYQPSYGTGTQSTTISGNQYAQDHYAGHAQYHVPHTVGTQAPAQFAAAEQSTCSQGPAPQGYYPYAQNPSLAFDSSYPNEEDMSSKYPRGCAMGISSQGYDLNIDALMPASWKQTPNCGDAAYDNTQWSKYAPSRQAFDRYITAAGSARLSLNTRWGLNRNIGIPLLLRQGPPVPLSTNQVPFNDSSYRNDLIYQTVGRYPQNITC